MTEKMISRKCVKDDKKLQEVSVENINQLRRLGYSIAKLEASLILLLPIGICYEDWCFLHKIIDGDIDDR